MGSGHAGGRQRPFSEKPSQPITWLELWAVGIYDLHLPEAEFWDLTIAQFVVLSKRHLEEQKRLDARAALICAVLANIHRDPKKHASFTVEDFMPGYERKPFQRQTPDQMLEMFRGWNAMLGGKWIKKEKNGQ